MEDIHNFAGGLHSDFDPQNQPPNTYRKAYNWIRLEDGSLVNEKGTEIVTGYPLFLGPVGTVVLEEEVILFSYGLNTEPFPAEEQCEIGVVNTNGVYTTIISSLELGLAPTHNIKGVARKDYRGHRIVYYWDINGFIPARRLDLDEIPVTDVDAETKLFVNTSAPIVKATSITEDGNLPTGVYQFSARLVTSSLNKGTTSLLTNIVPIVNESTTGGTESYDGALPQTASFKSINLQISNIDTKFKFIEIIATTYEGLTNTLKSNVIATKLITGTTMSHRYSSIEENGEEVILDELTIDPTSYDYPKAGEQKDGTLILGNLQATKYNYDFQSIANNAVIKYVIKELDYSENINMSSGSYNATNTGGGTDTGIATSEFDNYKTGTYTTDFRGHQRDEVYSFALVPLFKNGSVGDAYHIPGSLIEGLVGFPGNAANSSTKQLGWFTCADETYPSGFGYPVGKVRYHKMPSMEQEAIFNAITGKIRVLGIKVEYDLSSLGVDQENVVGIAIVRELRTEANKTILAQGLINPTINRGDKKFVTPWSGKSAYNYSDAIDDYNYTQVAFYSPETTILRNSMASATHIKPVAYISGNSYLVADQRNTPIDTQFAHTFLNYINFTPYTSSHTLTHPSVSVNKDYTKYVNPNGGNFIIDDVTLNTVGSNGYVFFKTTTNVPIYFNMGNKDGAGATNDVTGKGEISFDMSGNPSKVHFRTSEEGVVDNTHRAGGYTVRNLFNILDNSKTNPYGEVLDTEYILVGHKLLDGDNFIECYGGDTFINKTSLVNTTDCFMIDDTAENIHFKSVNYFWCESTVNTAYRHYTVENGLVTNVPYYPKSRKFYTGDATGILNYLTDYGHATGYNKQYSFENTLKKFYSKSLIAPEDVTRFENRVIYSEQSIEGEQFDAYRLFLQNNYHDVPKNKGEITNIFVHQNDLFIHTTQTLWKSSFNERVTQTTSVGEVVLGNGGKFPRPSLEMFPHAGGYAGSIHPLATCSTPYGTFFVDALQKKIFLLGSSFEEIDAGMSTTIREHFTGIDGILSAFDYENDRWILVFRTAKGNPTYLPNTLSYYPKLKSYSSYHDFYPRVICSVNDNLFVSDKGSNTHTSTTLGFMNRGVYTNYFGEELESYIILISNDNPLVGKTFDNVVVDSNLPFTYLYVGNFDDSDSVGKDLVVDDSWEYEGSDSETRITKQNGEWRFAIPLKEDEDNSRFKGKYLEVFLSNYNSEYERFIVKYIKFKYRANAR